MLYRCTVTLLALVALTACPAESPTAPDEEIPSSYDLGAAGGPAPMPEPMPEPELEEQPAAAGAPAPEPTPEPEQPAAGAPAPEPEPEPAPAPEPTPEPTPAASPTRCKVPSGYVFECATASLTPNFLLLWSVGDRLYGCGDSKAVQCKRGDECSASNLDTDATVWGVCL